MTTKHLDGSEDRAADPTYQPMSKAHFRGTPRRGLEAFGWHGSVGKMTMTVHTRVVDHRTLYRPRRA